VSYKKSEKARFRFIGCKKARDRKII